MTKEVLLTISGLQLAVGEESQNVEIITAGSYYKKNDAHYILYDEVSEGSDEITKNIIKVRDEQMDVTKKGTANVHMVFQRNRKNDTYYFTPFGSLLVGIDARSIEIQEEEQNINIEVQYGLEINHEPLADCTISMNVKSKEDKSFRIRKE